MIPVKSPSYLKRRSSELQRSAI